MTVMVFVRGVNEASELRDRVKEVVCSSLKRFAPRIQKATVRVEDETGPARDRTDKVCSISLKLRDGEVRVRKVGDSFSEVVAVALDRIRAALSRHLNRNKRGVGEG